MNDMFLSEDDLQSRHSEEVQELHNQLKRQEDIVQEYRREHGKLEVFFNKVLAAIQPITPLDSVYEKIRVSPKSDTEVFPVMQITDSHHGEVQLSDEIEGFNEFNPEICDARNLGFAKSALEWMQLHRGVYKISQLHMLFTGDLISGDIHDELRVTNAYPVPEQIVRASQIHSQQIALVAPYFERVVVEFLTEDNHSRLTKKPQAKEAGMNSYNYLIGKMIEAFIQKLPNVDFRLHPMHMKVIHVSNMKYLITHGQGIKSWMGVPWYGLERRLGREAIKRQSAISGDYELAQKIGFDKMVTGHFHTPFDTANFSCGGSVSGTNAYDHQAGRYADPSQAAWMVHPKYGEFNRINFQLKYFDNAGP